MQRSHLHGLRYLVLAPAQAHLRVPTQEEGNDRLLHKITPRVGRVESQKTSVKIVVVSVFGGALADRLTQIRFPTTTDIL